MAWTQTLHQLQGFVFGKYISGICLRIGCGKHQVLFGDSEQSIQLAINPCDDLTKVFVFLRKFVFINVDDE